jgi:hypothetical protein
VSRKLRRREEKLLRKEKNLAFFQRRPPSLPNNKIPIPVKPVAQNKMDPLLKTKRPTPEKKEVPPKKEQPQAITQDREAFLRSNEIEKKKLEREIA